MYQPFLVWGTLSIFSVITASKLNNIQDRNPCNGNAADIIFVLDSSSSIWIVDYQKQLKFVADVVDSFNVGKGQSEVRVGAITFSDRAYLEFSVDQYADSNQLKNAIASIVHRQGRTNTADALRLLKKQVEPDLKNSRGPIIAIVITDGQSTDPIATKKEAKKLHQLGINVYAIGVGDSRMYDIDELKDIASDPDNGVYTVASYSALTDIAQKFQIQPCEEETTTTAKPTTTAAPTTTTTTTTTAAPPPTFPTTTLRPTEMPVHTEPVKRDPTSIIIFGFDMLTMGHYRSPIIYQFIDTFLPLSGYGRYSISSLAYCPDTFNIPVTSLMNKDPFDIQHSFQIGKRLPGLVDIVQQIQSDMAANIVRNAITGRVGNQVAVLFIDPTVTVITPELLSATNALKRQGVKLFLINIGQNTWSQPRNLNSMSSQPYRSYVFNYPTYDQLLYSVKRTPFRFRAMCNQYVTPPSLYGIRI